MLTYAYQKRETPSNKAKKAKSMQIKIGKIKNQFFNLSGDARLWFRVGSFDQVENGYRINLVSNPLAYKFVPRSTVVEV